MDLVANFIDRHAVVGVDKDGTEQIRRTARPVLKRLLDKVGERNDEATQIPDSHNYVRGSNFFDPSPFTFHHHRVIQSNRLR